MEDHFDNVAFSLRAVAKRFFQLTKNMLEAEFDPSAFKSQPPMTPLIHRAMVPRWNPLRFSVTTAGTGLEKSGMNPFGFWICLSIAAEKVSKDLEP